MLRWKVAQFFEKRWKNKMIKKLGINGYLEYLQQNARQILKFYELNPSFDGLKILEIGSGFCGIVSVVDAELKVAVDPVLIYFPHMIGQRYDAVYLPVKAEELTDTTVLYDIVFCSNTLNHVDKPKVVLGNIYELMKTKGSLYLDIHFQRMSHVHPHTFNRSKIVSLVERYFSIVQEFESSTQELFGEGNCQVWGCHARK